MTYLAGLGLAGEDLHGEGRVQCQQAHHLLARVAAGAQHRDAGLGAIAAAGRYPWRLRRCLG